MAKPKATSVKKEKKKKERKIKKKRPNLQPLLIKIKEKRKKRKKIKKKELAKPTATFKFPRKPERNTAPPYIKFVYQSLQDLFHSDSHKFPNIFYVQKHKCIYIHIYVCVCVCVCVCLGACIQFLNIFNTYVQWRICNCRIHLTVLSANIIKDSGSGKAPCQSISLDNNIIIIVLPCSNFCHNPA